MKKKVILLVEDDTSSRRGIVSLLRSKYNVLDRGKYSTAVDLFNERENDIDLVISDLQLPDSSGVDLLKFVKKKNSSIPFIIITAFGTVKTAVDSIKSGAYDFIQKPIDIDKLELVISRALESRELKKENEKLKLQINEASKFSKQIIGHSEEIQNVLKVAKQVASVKSTVLITGESGTGKELIAKFIHDNSDNRGNFVVVNVSALPSTLLESELFGYEKGAFTGANESRKGRFELAENGTIFLDEISEIDMSIQVKLLRVIENKTIERVGSSKTINVNARIITASNKDLLDMVNHDLFRRDLFYRLNVINIKLPSLRERRGDIPILVRHFLDKFLVESQKKNLKISDDVMNILCKYDWPGNIRELKNCIERMVVLSEGSIIDRVDISNNISGYIESELSEDFNIKNNEIKLIKLAMNKFKGNKSEMARALGIDRKTLNSKLKRY